MNLINEEVARQIVSLYYSAIPMSQREIANKLGIARRSVCYYIDKHKKNEVSSLQSKRDRPSKKARTIFFPNRRRNSILQWHNLHSTCFFILLF